MPINLPNFITIGRILLVPITVWLIISGEFLLAFGAFVAAGISDGVDGYIARRFDQRSELGAYLDPIADKALLVSIYVSLGFLKFLPAGLVILVVTRDVLIVGAVILAWVVGKPMVVAPSMASKVNTVGQIILAGVVLGLLGMKGSMELMEELFVNVGKSTGATVISAAAGTQFALEKNNLRNGVFTYSLLEYLQQHEHATIRELKQYVNQRVKQLTAGLQVPTARNENIIMNWEVW